jgi:hypothetical protein
MKAFRMSKGAQQVMRSKGNAEYNAIVKTVKTGVRRMKYYNVVNLTIYYLETDPQLRQQSIREIWRNNFVSKARRGHMLRECNNTMEWAEESTRLIKGQDMLKGL